MRGSDNGGSGRGRMKYFAWEYAQTHDWKHIITEKEGKGATEKTML